MLVHVEYANPATFISRLLGESLCATGDRARHGEERGGFRARVATTWPIMSVNEHPTLRSQLDEEVVRVIPDKPTVYPPSFRMRDDRKSSLDPKSLTRA